MMTDKAGETYWSSIWAAEQVPEPFNPRRRSFSQYVKQRYHQFFVEKLSGLQPRGKAFLEIGCARSAWLPYFAQEFGFNVYGLDYSELGCQQARQVLSDAGIPGEIVCADFFSPPPTLQERFDVVVSFGVVEHFTDTTACLAAFTRFLKPGGLVLTLIPNMVSGVGFFQKVLNRPIFDIHILLDVVDLARAHELAGFEVLDCDYFLSTHFGVCNLNGIRPGSVSWLVKQSVLIGLQGFSWLVWQIEARVGCFKARRSLSPYIICTARKPA
jgi:cyclopropane fatty-acyl-phospholipid synthase-like methyltransferase